MSNRFNGMAHPTSTSVLQADDACMLAMELQFNPIVDDVAAFDIYPE